MWTLTVTLLILVVTFWLLWRRKKFSKLRELNIPGPEPSIFFGNMLEIIRKTPLKCHEEWIQKYGKVVGYYFGSTPMVLIADIDMLKKIQVSDFNKFMNRPANRFSNTNRQEGFSQQLVNLRDKRWKEIRSILTPSFTAAKMKQMTPLMNGAIDSLMNNVEKSKGEPIDIYPLYQGLTMDVIGRTAFGIHTDVQNDPNDPFLRSSRALFSNDLRSILSLLAISFREFDKLWIVLSRLNLMRKNQGVNPIRELINAVKDVIGMRRRDVKSRRPDLLQLMMDAQISETEMAALTADDLTARDDDKQTARVTSGKLIRQMTDSDILDNSLLFFLAGYETTSTALAFTTHLLVHHPEVQDKIRKEVQGLVAEKGELDYTSVNELQYLDHVLNESLRLYPPIYLFVNREAGEDVDFGTFRLPKGISVQVPVYQLHHNKDLWSDPEEFRPERFAPENKKHNPIAFQPFGGGPRNCVGMRFAQMEAKLALARLLAKYRLEKCDLTDKEPITLRIAPAIINPAKGIYLKAVPCEQN